MELLGSDKSIMNCLIEFTYKGNIRIDAENVLALHHAASYFMLSSWKSHVHNF